MTRICAFVLTVVGSAFAAVPTADSLPEFIHVDGERLRTQDGADFVIQGVGVGSLRAEPVEKDYEAIAGLKFNTVTLMLSYRSFYAETDPGDYIELGWKRLDEHVALARKYGLHVILQMSSVEGAQFVPIKGVAFDYRIWVQPELQERFLNLWQAIAERYKDEQHILGYGIFSEPVVSGTAQQWIDLANKAVSRIRSVDKNHVLFVERLYGEFGTRREMSGIDFSPERSFFLVPDRNVVYQFYFF